VATSKTLVIINANPGSIPAGTGTPGQRHEVRK